MGAISLLLRYFLRLRKKSYKHTFGVKLFPFRPRGERLISRFEIDWNSGGALVISSAVNRRRFCRALLILGASRTSHGPEGLPPGNTPW